MKNHIAFCRFFSPLAVLAAACVIGGSASGQGTPPPFQPQPKKEASPETQRYLLEIVNGELQPGGSPATLARIVDVLLGVYPNETIVLAPGLGQVQVRDLKLRNTDLPETLDALRVASGDAFVWQNGLLQNPPPPVGPRAIDPSTGLPVLPASPREASSLYILTRNDASVAGNPRRMVEVFNLSGYLEQLGKRDEKDIAASLEKIKMIVSDTLNQVMQGNVQPEDQPRFQFHPGANLFIVIGPPQAIEVTRKVVNALPGVAGARAYPPPGTDTKAAEDAFRRRYGLQPAGAPEPPAPRRPPPETVPAPGK
jgi:hypothetical protein